MSNDKTPDAAKAAKARVLVAGIYGGKAYAANDVATFSPELLKAHKAELDASPAAVKYAEELKKPAAAEKAIEE